MTLFLPYRRPLLGGPFCRNELWRRAKAVPSLDLRFAENRSLVDATTGLNLITFSRTSNATFVGSNGLIQTASAGTPRFDHNPSTGESLGLLVEEQRTNLLLHSEAIGVTGWTGFRYTATTNAATSPDGQVSADLIAALETNSGGAATLQNFTPSVSTFTLSVFAKAGVSSYLLLRPQNSSVFTEAAQAWFNLATGTKGVTTHDGVVFTGASSQITPYGNGWYRCSLTFSLASSAFTGNVRLYLTDTDGLLEVTEGASVYLWGAQLEAGAFPTSYIPTGASAVTRAADVASISGSNFSSWYRQDEGTIFVDILRAHPGSFPIFTNIYNFNDGTDNNRILLYGVQGGQVVSNASVRSAGVDQTDYVALPSVFPGSNKFAQALAVNSSIFAGNGVLTAQDNSVTLPVGIDRLVIGAFRTFNGQWGGHIRRLTYWPQALPGRLQAITQ